MLVRAMLSHYRRHPMQLGSLAMMIMVATVLWTGVAELTSQAERSLEMSESAVSVRQQVVRHDGQPVTVEDFVVLRRAGYCVAPWVEAPASAVSDPASRASGQVIGIDPLAMACLDDSGESSQTGELNGEPFIDLSRVTPGIGTFSLLIRDDHDPLPEAYMAREVQGNPQTGELADSFLLNLDALSVLVLLITGLLVRSVYHLGLAQRRGSFALLRRFGVTDSQIQRLLAAELVLLTLVSVLPGVLIGHWLATVLGAGFGQAMGSLFDVTLYAGDGQLSVRGWSALLMTALVLVVCLVDRWLPDRALGARDSGGWMKLSGCVALVGLALVAISVNLVLVFVGVALVFIGIGGLTPGVLSRLAATRARSTSAQQDGSEMSMMAHWRYRELGVMVRRLALPLVALQFAVAAVLAIQALVTTFEDTFDVWLGQRLSADYYVEMPQDAETKATLTSLALMKSLGHWHMVIRGGARVFGTASEDRAPSSVDVLALTPFTPLVTDWTLLSAIEDPWEALQSNGVMVNEQLARRMSLTVGDSLRTEIAGQRLERLVAGIYADYGRPAGEILLPYEALPAGFDSRFRSLSVNSDERGLGETLAKLRQVWGAEDIQYRDNGSIRTLASNVFAQTFLLTRAISVLTLVLASVSLLVMSWVFFSTRGWYFQLLTIWGLSRRSVQNQLRRLAATLTLSITVAALPLGIWLTWVLVSRINPLAFGWSLPMAVYPLFWLELAALAALVGLATAALMNRTLAGQPDTSQNPGANLMAGGER